MSRSRGNHEAIGFFALRTGMRARLDITARGHPPSFFSTVARTTSEDGACSAGFDSAGVSVSRASRSIS